MTKNLTALKAFYTSLGGSSDTAAIDENIVAGNIKSGVTILGVEGTYTGE